MAPTRPDSTISSSPSPPSPSSSGRGAPTSSWRFTTALVTVSATSTERKAPTRFSSAESITAVFGFSAPVAMDVAMALPVSWKPLVKSKAKAVAITSSSTTNSSSGTALVCSFRPGFAQLASQTSDMSQKFLNGPGAAPAPLAPIPEGRQRTPDASGVRSPGPPSGQRLNNWPWTVLTNCVREAGRSRRCQVSGAWYQETSVGSGVSSSSAAAIASSQR